MYGGGGGGGYNGGYSNQQGYQQPAASYPTQQQGQQQQQGGYGAAPSAGQGQGGFNQQTGANAGYSGTPAVNAGYPGAAAPYGGGGGNDSGYSSATPGYGGAADAGYSSGGGQHRGTGGGTMAGGYGSGRAAADSGYSSGFNSGGGSGADQGYSSSSRGAADQGYSSGRGGGGGGGVTLAAEWRARSGGGGTGTQQGYSSGAEQVQQVQQVQPQGTAAQQVQQRRAEQGYSSSKGTSQHQQQLQDQLQKVVEAKKLREAIQQQVRFSIEFRLFCDCFATEVPILTHSSRRSSRFSSSSHYCGLGHHRRRSSRHSRRERRVYRDTTTPSIGEGHPPRALAVAPPVRVAAAAAPWAGSRGASAKPHRAVPPTARVRRLPASSHATHRSTCCRRASCRHKRRWRPAPAAASAAAPTDSKAPRRPIGPAPAPGLPREAVPAAGTAPSPAPAPRKTARPLPASESMSREPHHSAWSPRTGTSSKSASTQAIPPTANDQSRSISLTDLRFRRFRRFRSIPLPIALHLPGFRVASHNLAGEIPRRFPARHNGGHPVFIPPAPESGRPTGRQEIGCETEVL